MTSGSLEVVSPPARQQQKRCLRIIVDTREQNPYTFPVDGITTIRRKLDAGDYSLEGYENRVAVERKSLDDFVSTVIRHRRRFHKELRILQQIDTACVIVEAGLDDVLMGRFTSGAHPHSVFGAMISIIIDFGIPVFFCADRQIACRFVEAYLRRFQDKMDRIDAAS